MPTSDLNAIAKRPTEVKGTRRRVEIRPIEAMINHNTTEVCFDDNLKVPAENIIGGEGKGFRYILDGMNAERILVAQECVFASFATLALKR